MGFFDKTCFVNPMQKGGERQHAYQMSRITGGMYPVYSSTFSLLSDPQAALFCLFWEKFDQQQSLQENCTRKWRRVSHLWLSWKNVSDTIKSQSENTIGIMSFWELKTHWRLNLILVCQLGNVNKYRWGCVHVCGPTNVKKYFSNDKGR